MAAYLLRRLFQMSLIVLLATMAIYALLNLAPGGPLSGIKLIANNKVVLDPATLARLESYLGIDKPLGLRYLVWLLGDDWLGADAVYLGIRSPAAGRFYAGSAIAYAKPGYPLWIAGEQTRDAEGKVRIVARKIWVDPTGTPPEGTFHGKLLEFNADGLKVKLTSAAGEAVVQIDRTTEWIKDDLPERPDGTWLPLGWLFGPQGLLGDYAHFHGTGRGILRLDWGTSWKVASGQPVIELIRARLGNTLLLMITSTLLSLLVAIPVGIFSAVKQYSKLDYAVTTFTFFGTAMPAFWFGLVMILIFSVGFQKLNLPYLPAGSVYSVRPPAEGSLLGLLDAAPGGLPDRAIHLLMPTAVLSLLYMATWSRFMRASMLEVLRQDYVRTARAKGLDERIVIVRHAMRNALIPIVTIVVLQIPGLFGGAIITETIFSWTGMGRLFYDALSTSDWPVVMVLLFIEAVLVVISTLIGDLLYTVVDPRIRYD